MIDIKGNLPGVAGALSNFRTGPFVFDGVECLCTEGPLQAFKFDDPEVQREICKLSGRDAKKKGQERNDTWKGLQRLWWQGVEYDRHSQEYQYLLDRLYDALLQNTDFQSALLASGQEELTHSIGNPDPRDTVLTEQELCSRLRLLRERLRQTIE